jgi:hypothetical protein
VHHGQTQSLAKDAGEGGLAATGIAQNYNPLHGDFLSRKKPPIVQVLEGQLKAEGWVDRATPEGVNLIQDETIARNQPLWKRLGACFGGFSSLADNHGT